MGAKQPLTRALPLDHVGVSAPIPSVIGFMAGWHWQKMWVPIYLYCSNCTKFGQLILRKIIKIVATRCKILSLKCTKFAFGWGSAPDPAGGAYSAPPVPLAGFRGPTSKGRGRRGDGRGGKGRGGKERGRRGKGKGRGLSLPKVNFQVTSLIVARVVVECK